MTRYVMLADLERCVGCQTCTAACRHSNATSPAVQWRKVLDIESGEFPNVSRTFVPVGCQHCADPPCMHVCPSTATGQRADGLVTIDYDICIGCAYCDVACPYQARYKVSEPRFAYGKAMPSEKSREAPERIGVAQKCTFCIERIDHGRAHGLTPGVDPDATPACVNACIADALHFGDIEDPQSNVSKLVASHETFKMHAELGTDPGFFYLYARKGNGAAPDFGGAALHGSEAGLIRTRGVEPWHQEHWDWKAAGNFMCGGTGAGLLIFAALAAVVAGAPLSPLGLVALAFIGAGLFLVWLKIGRPWRALYVFRQPGRSWMTREAWVALPLFGTALAAMWFGGALLAVLAAAFAALFLYCQAMILEQAKGIPAWRERTLVPLLLATGLAEGGGLFVAATAFGDATVAAAVLLALVALRALLWLRYRMSLERGGAPAKALAALDERRGLFHAVGSFAPFVLLAAGLLVAQAAAPLFVVAGLCAFAAGFAFKYVLVCRAGYNQGFAIERTPVRGRGQPGPGIKPGWSLP